MTNQELNKRFAELAEIPIYLKVAEGGFHVPDIPDFVVDPRLVLRELVRLGLLYEFIIKRYLHQHPIMFAHDILDTTEGFMVKVAIKFVEAQQD